MKTPQEFLDSCQLAPGIWNGDVKSLIEQRDAEHRAELLKVQDDLLQAANREVMTAALIERLRGELAEAARKATLALGLAKDINAAYGCACDFDGEQCDCGGDGTGPAGSDGCWSCQARDVLAAPPPAESTPVQVAPPDDVRERLAEHDRVIARMQHAWIGHDSRLAALEAKGVAPWCYSIDCRYYGQRHATPHEPQEDHPKGAKP